MIKRILVCSDGSEHALRAAAMAAEIAAKFTAEVTVLSVYNAPPMVLPVAGIPEPNPYIAVETLSPDLFVRPEANAVSQGLPIIAVDTVPPATSNITTYVGNDNITAGAMLAPATASVGCWLKASLLAAAAVIVNVVLVAPVRPVLEALSV